MTDLTRARDLIALAKELDAKATPGEWEPDTAASGEGFVRGPRVFIPRHSYPREQIAADVQFIAAARTAWPETARLLAEQIAATEAAEHEQEMLRDEIEITREFWEHNFNEQKQRAEAADAKLASAEKVIDRGRVLASVVQGWLREGRIASALPGRTLERHSELDRFVDALAAHDTSAPKEGE